MSMSNNQEKAVVERRGFKPIFSVMLAGLSAFLTPWGLEVITLSQSQQFWQVLIATSPDLVVLDLEMPIVNGLELCQVVRQDAEWGDLPILVVTAHTEAKFLQQAFAAGADDFITKPVLGPELVTRVLSRIQRNKKRRFQTEKK
jgi:DNA-binding response OmpR family regulator